MTESSYVLGIIGVGSIAAAIVEGLCSAEGAPAVLLSPRNATLAAELARRYPSVEVADSNQTVVARSSVVILSVRPQDAAAILAELRFSEEQDIVSVMAGVRSDELRRFVSPARDIGRAIPLPAVAQRNGLTPIHPATAAAKAIFGPLGGTLDLEDETAFDAISAASGTVAAHFAYLSAIAAWLAERKVPEDAARRLVASVYAGLAHDLAGEAPDFARLARDHTTPGGLNEQFRRHLTEAGMFDQVKDGLDRLFKRLVPPQA